ARHEPNRRLVDLWFQNRLRAAGEQCYAQATSSLRGKDPRPINRGSWREALGRQRQEGLEAPRQQGSKRPSQPRALQGEAKEPRIWENAREHPAQQAIRYRSSKSL